jgi:Cu/Ag efflux protein CusF
VGQVSGVPPQEPNPPAAAYRASFNIPEAAMRKATIILAGTVALAIICSGASAQQALNGTVTTIDRINGTIAIKQTQSGTVGANTGDAAEEFKVQSGLSLDEVHAGDRVSYTATEMGGFKTITKLQRQ